MGNPPECGLTKRMLLVPDWTILTDVIDAKERWDVMSNDAPNTFVQAPVPVEHQEVGNQVIVKVTGSLVELVPELYKKFVMCEKG